MVYFLSCRVQCAFSFIGMVGYRVFVRYWPSPSIGMVGYRVLGVRPLGIEGDPRGVAPGQAVITIAMTAINAVPTNMEIPFLLAGLPAFPPLLNRRFQNSNRFINTPSRIFDQD